MPQLSRSPILQRAAPVWRWWAGELKALLPDRLQHLRERLRQRLEIETDGSELRVFHAGAKGRELLGETALSAEDPESSAAALRDIVDAGDGQYDSAVLRVPAARALSRRTRLPIAARDTLEEAVGYDLDRQTPFSEDQVYYGAREVAVDAAADWVEAELELVPKTDMKPALKAIRAAGIALDRMEASRDGPNLLPPAERAEQGFPYSRLATGLGGLAAALIVVAVYLPLERMESKLDSLESEMRTARAATSEVERLRSDLELMRDREARLFERKRSEPSAIGLLDAVSRALPEDSFAIRFDYDREELELTGFSRKASELIGTLEGLDTLSDVRFVSPVTQDPRIERERFNVAAQVKGGERGGAGRAP